MPSYFFFLQADSWAKSFAFWVLVFKRGICTALLADTQLQKATYTLKPRSVSIIFLKHLSSLSLRKKYWQKS